MHKSVCTLYKTAFLTAVAWLGACEISQVLIVDGKVSPRLHTPNDWLGSKWVKWSWLAQPPPPPPQKKKNDNNSELCMHTWKKDLQGYFIGT